MPTTTKTTTTQQFVTQPVTTQDYFAQSVITNQEYHSQTDPQKTKNFIAVDYINNIYECNIIVEKSEGNEDYQIKVIIERLSSVNFSSDNTAGSKNYDRIHRIRFFRETKTNIE